MMEEDTEYTKLPLEDRCVHKLWKARQHGYEEVATLFRRIDDEKSPEFGKYLGLVKKFVVDSNAVAQEKGLEAVLAFIENYALAGKTVGDVMAGIVTKCIAAPKTKTKELAVQITLMYIEIEKYEIVQEELFKGMDHKNPKIVGACMSALTLALREFGSKVINIKPLVKKVLPLLEDRDKSVRDEGKAMIIEMYRWVGIALRPQLAGLKSFLVTEMEAEHEKVKGERVTPTRYLKSQQEKQAKIASEAAAAGDAEDGEEDETDAVEEIDPYDLMDPVDILSKLPKDFYDKLEAKKWQERKEAVELLEQLLHAPKLENGDYGDLVKALKKIISKDTNVMVIAVAGKCLASLANGLKKRFQPYALACIPCLLEKFREKKQNVVVALKEAIDATYSSTSIEAIQEDVLAALENKNPQVKAETASFLARCFTKCTPVMLNKKLLKAYITVLLKLLNDPDPTVRENSAEAVGTVMKVVGEKAIMPFMTDVDPLRLPKIKECCEKAVIVAKVPKAPCERPSTAPAKLARGDRGAAPKVVKRPSSTTTNKKVGLKKQSASVPSIGGGKAKASTKLPEKELSPEEVDERGAEILSEEVISGLMDSNWKNRLSAVEQFVQAVSEMEPSEIPAQVMIRILNKKPGLKDTNFQVLKARLEALKMLSEIAPLSSTSLNACLLDVADKLADPKNGALAGQTLSALAEATKLDLVAGQVLDFAFSQKSPKIQQEALAWLAEAIKEFGFVIQPKPLLETVKKAVLATQPGVRTAGIQFLGTLYLYMGQQLLSVYFDSEKPFLKQQLQAEFDKHEGETPPTPTRGQVRTPKIGDDDEEDEDQSPDDKIDLNVHEMMPHVDVSSHITEAIILELQDKNWKVRNEALQKLEELLKKNRYINSNLGELPPVLAARLVDSNSKIAAAAINLCQSLGTAMGSQCKAHVQALFPALLQGLGDSKSWIRTAATACINTWGENCGFKEFFKNEMISDALKSDSPTLRAELWAWLAEKLPDLPCKSIPKEELAVCLPTLFANLEDRNADVRKNAQEAVLAFMIHMNYSPMLKATEKLKPASRLVVNNILEKVQVNLPTKPAPPSKKGISDDQENAKSVKSGGAKAAASAGTSKGPAKGKVASKPGGRKKDDDVDTSPLLQTNSLKNQRSIDEHKLKVLKWNFTTPREEFVEQLRDQMITANVNKSLTANMFHSDFKYHLRAIDSLAEDLGENESSTVANLDLILKWMTLRFFDTNPSVLLKGLEYLSGVFGVLTNEGYSMFEFEAASFIPYLILKIGDPKDSVRNGVKVLLKQVERMFSTTKLFGYLMDGLKSKNARQRTECLEQLGSMIEIYGVCVCNPSPSVALKEIARQISDRDNSVRNAALNCVVHAYFLEGEKVYKMVGQISDKDLSLLEERIKRAAKNRPPGGSKLTPMFNANGKVQQQQLQLPQPQKIVRQGSEGNLNREPTEPEEQSPPPTMRNIIVKPRPVSGPFGLDTKLLERIEGEGIDLCAPKLKEFDLKEILEAPMDIPKASFATASLNTDMFQTASVPQSWALNNCSTTEQVLDLGIMNVASPDLDTAWKACMQVEAVLSSDKCGRVSGREDSLMQSAIMQLRLLSTAMRHGKPRQLMGNGYKNLLLMIAEFYNHKNLAQQVSKETLIDLVEQLLMLLVNQNLESLENGTAFVRFVNMLMVRVIERSDHSNIASAFLKHLHNCSANNNTLPPRFEELTMKCLWKIIRLMPSWEGDLDITMILLDLHQFLQDYPAAVWKQRQSDTPVRTVKTLVHTLVRMIGGEMILQYVARIDNHKESELYTYLIKLCKKVKPEDMKSSHKKESKSHHRLSKVTHEQLSEIFKKIGSKDQTKEGLELLYDFQEQHPEADVEPFLRKSSQFFQDYIERGLLSIQMDRKRTGNHCHKTLSSTTSMSSLGLQESGGPVTPFSDSGDSSAYTEHSRTAKSRVGAETQEDLDSNMDSKNALYYLERLRALQARAGMDPASVPLESSQEHHSHRVLRDENIVSDENLNLQHQQDCDDELSVPRNASSASRALGIEELRKRLEAVKGSKR